jgi:ATP-dependent helicase HrpB
MSVLPRGLPDAVASLPIVGSLDPILGALVRGRNVVVVAEPGAGKTTVVPLVLLDQPWCTGRVVVVEPRRVAARAAATRLASLLGEKPGDTVGWRMRGDTKIGRTTRLEVVTDGVLTRMLQHDPSLDGVSCVVLDELHERSLDVDLGLALCVDAQQGLRDDLRIVAMSATIDAEGVSALLGDPATGPAPVVVAPGRTFPVETRWVGPATPTLRPAAVASAVRTALASCAGDVLVFLPGAREIRAVERELGGLGATTHVLPLHGTLPPAAQDRALAPAAPGHRKVVLATNLAETSLTIDGIGAVVDSGWVRRAVLDPRRAMSSLVTVRVSQASAEQRRGRAGRLGPGVCFRLWSEHEHRLLDDHDPPEILQADLVGPALDLARWGDPTGASLRWLDAPPAHLLDAARSLLVTLGVLDDRGRLTDHGRAVARLPVHPRLAHAIVRAAAAGDAGLACDVAALLADRDVGPDRRDVELAHRVELLHHGGRDVPGVDRVRREAARLRRLVGVAAAEPLRLARLGTVVALAYPDRIARRRDAAGRYLLANGVGAALDAHDELARQDWLAVAETGTPAGDAVDLPITLAAPIERADAERVATAEERTVAEWDRRARDVRVERQTRIGAIVLKAAPVDDRDAARRALVEGVRVEGLGLLHRIAETTTLRARVAFCRTHLGDTWPDLSDAALLSSLDDWLLPELVRVDARRRADLARVDVARALGVLLPWSLAARLDELAPTHLVTPKGRRRDIDYTGPQPTVSVRLQDAFGWHDTPRLAGGRVPLVVALLSPADRPVQVTADLAGFWRGSYAQVRAELRGRYPKHAWPEDPTR